MAILLGLLCLLVGGALLWTSIALRGTRHESLGLGLFEGSLMCIAVSILIFLIEITQ